VDMFWYGEVKHMQNTLEDIDDIINQTLPILDVQPSMNIGFCMKPPSESPEDDLF